MHLLIDVGNSRIKWRLIIDEYNDEEVTQYGLLADLATYIESLETDKIVVLLAAVNQTEQLKRLLSEYEFKAVIAADSQPSQGGIVNSYQQPERMGIDRWLAMIAAFSARTKQQGIIVVDAGSALTIDVVSACGVHLGGYIVPGLLMAQRALFLNTERVIQYEEGISSEERYEKLHKLGNNTVQCVEYGVINQLIALVRQVQEEYVGYEIFFTGGDGQLLATSIQAGTVDENLVLKGLWQVRN